MNAVAGRLGMCPCPIPGESLVSWIDVVAECFDLSSDELSPMTKETAEKLLRLAEEQRREEPDS
ncbi:hypothetical protein [Nocardia salmonicida]|uniref:hypothetical protein n=1 Tax=Nocardia salmonicida TaxID=53431 RepID=UPI000A420CEA|nr:hypothetical protein [Nocardia salmonicida]